LTATPKTKVLIAGCARNCSAALPGVLKNIEAMALLWDDAAFVFVENDSTDETPSILRDWCATRPQASLHSYDRLAEFCRVRTIRLAKLRQQCLSVLRAEHPNATHYVIFDCDEVNAGPLDLDGVRQAVEFLDAGADRAGVFAGQDGLYYDLWALRHTELCPQDIWEELYDYAVANKTTDEEAFRQTFRKRLFPLPRSAPPLEVDSAFGGLGLYKAASVLRNPRRYVGYKLKRMPYKGGWRDLGWEVCEHVAFHAGLREQGERLFVLPFLVNAGPKEINPNPSIYQWLIFDPAEANPADIEAPPGGRNEPCPCGSGKRFKHCHGALERPATPEALKGILAL
jgi:hypothetical protein